MFIVTWSKQRKEKIKTYKHKKKSCKILKTPNEKFTDPYSNVGLDHGHKDIKCVSQA